MELRGRNVHQLLPVALDAIIKHGKGSPSRNGPVLTIDEPVTIRYDRPVERVLFHAQRNANPFFHFMECLWMMAGRNDVQLPAHYVKTMSNFSDDGRTFNGAYGYRWRKHFGYDQLLEAINQLKSDKNSRRVVISMWDARQDLGTPSKDIPCNLLALPRISDGKLDLTVFNRSNDLVWGALGANAVHFSFLQEWIALALGIPVGRYFQVTNNLHLYVNTHIKLAEDMAAVLPEPCPYDVEDLEPFPIMSVRPDQWMGELAIILDEGPVPMGLKEPFFRRVALPIREAWDAYLDGDFPIAMRTIGECADPAWRKACTEWLERARYRKARLARAQDSGVSYEE